MRTPEEDRDDPRDDELARERSAKQRNITAPTPPDVRAKGEDDEDEDDGEQPEPPTADTRAP
ncbi:MULTISPECIES: hypothetical protein [Streptomyces]|uniref:hypothetical protein n=1 Tax=Streptomyces TaxID=1883 RepID=UPI001F32E4C0|nr:hypothetical protein [Streptomyces noursei]MCE4946666.1 hypothetical protein [Streptomyces noursei]